MNSKDRKGVVARVWSWVQSFWQQPDGNICQMYVGLAVITLVLAFCVSPGGPAPVLVTLLVGLSIASMTKHLMWKDEKLLALRRALLRIAFEECRCGSESKCHCHVREARTILNEECPGAIRDEVRERCGQYRDEKDGRWIINDLPFTPIGPIPRDLDLTAYLDEFEFGWHRAHGQLKYIGEDEAKPQ